MLRKVIEQIIKQKQIISGVDLYNDLIRQEAAIGGTIFGGVESRRQRQFYCQDKQTWVWCEQWLDKNGQSCSLTTNYCVQPNNVIKTQDGGRTYQALSQNEAINLRDAAKIYYQKVMSELYSQPLELESVLA